MTTTKKKKKQKAKRRIWKEVSLLANWIWDSEMQVETPVDRLRHEVRPSPFLFRGEDIAWSGTETGAAMVTHSLRVFSPPTMTPKAAARRCKGTRTDLGSSRGNSFSLYRRFPEDVFS